MCVSVCLTITIYESFVSKVRYRENHRPLVMKMFDFDILCIYSFIYLIKNRLHGGAVFGIFALQWNSKLSWVFQTQLPSTVQKHALLITLNCTWVGL